MLTIVDRKSKEVNSIIAFDMDGVLLDSLNTVESSLMSALMTHGIPIAKDFDLRQSLGKPLVELVGLASSVLLSSIQIAACIVDYRRINDGITSSELTVYPGVLEMLAHSAELFDLCVLTTKNEKSAKRQLAVMGLSDYFVGVFGTVNDDVSVPKDVRWIQAEKFMSRNLPVEIALLVGDRASDILAARKLGRRALGVGWGYGSLEELIDASADGIATHPSAVPKLVQQLCMPGS